MIKPIVISLIGFGLGFAASEQLHTKDAVGLSAEMLFAVRYQSAEYKLLALEKIKQDDFEAAKSILEASLLLDENEMGACAGNSTLCSHASTQAFTQFRERKSRYLNN